MVLIVKGKAPMTLGLVVPGASSSSGSGVVPTAGTTAKGPPKTPPRVPLQASASTPPPASPHPSCQRGAMWLGPPPPPPRPQLMPHQGDMQSISVPVPKAGKGAMGACKKCGDEGRWKDMISVKIWIHVQETMHDAPDEYKWEYTCVSCHADLRGITLEEARAEVMQQRSTPAWRRRRSKLGRISRA